VNNELEIVWKKAAMAKFKLGLLSRNWAEKTEENHKIPYSGLLSGGGMNTGPPEYEALLLTTRQ
jgi:hypothetical protein